MIKSEDPGFYKKVKRISANYSTPKQERTTKENSHTQETQSFVKVRCVSLKERIKQKMNSLIEYFKTNEMTPSQSKTDEYNKTYGFNLGIFWNNLKRGYNKELFEDAKKKSPNMQKAYDKYLERREKAKDAQQKMNILIEHFKTNEKQPLESKTAEYNNKHGFNLGEFWNKLRKGHNKELFEDAKKKSPNMQKAYDKYLERRDKAKTPQQKMNILIEHFKTNEKHPSESKTAEYNNKHGFNLGNFWNNLMKSQNKELFEDAKKKSPNMKKAYDKFLKKKEERRKKVQKTPQEKMNILIEYFETNDGQPSVSEKEEYNKKHGFNLGSFCYSVMRGHSKQLFQDYLKKSPNMQKAYDKYLEKREKRTHKND